MSNLLSAGLVLPIALTVGVFVVASWISRRTGGHPLANPVLISVGLIILFLTITGLPYERYFEGTQLITFLLGPAIVALAVPMFRHLDKVRKAALSIFAGVVAGSVAAVLSALVISWAFGTERELVASLATKSITAPVAMGIAAQIGGVPSLAAVFSLLTGIIGAAFGPTLLNRLGMKEGMEQGLAMGTASHGIGTARIHQDSAEAGAFSGLAMGIAALIMGVAMPLAVRLFL